MIKSEERIQNIKEYILEFQFTYHRTPTMAQIAEAVGTVKSNVYKYLSEMEERGILTRSKREIVINDTIRASPELNRVPILGNVKNMCLCLWHCSGREIFSFCGQADTL